MPKENVSEGLFTRDSAWASGLRHIQFPTAFPRMSQLGGTTALSSISASCTRVMAISPFSSFQSIRMLFALMSVGSH
ncbi:hypothetical protein I7I50_04403 [Histoplasma capsulatum G186AR]|uniref:Uncharacterized protein n=1 Tax=Ajellomyces capsulatus TaxID=5037 RepID=A0A8H7YQE4_AJECA|nr:hypothetical protein I7I52_05311 [Histoplasma capsulatum]QSS75302.1 hypothetical protein I7I50_04403 [Histoplasma capsulatum G186AR]